MNRAQGFSLLETVIFIIVVGIALSGLVTLFVQNTRSSADPLIRERALEVAHAYMDEIIGKGFDENTPLGGGCVESGSNSCTNYCAAYSDALCVQSKCRLQAAGSCVPRDSLGGIATEEGSRNAYDDVDDYHGINEAPTGVAGAATGYAGFTVQVSVTQPAASWQGIDVRDLRLIQVDVTSPLGETINLQAYRVNF
jgi:MSHA pilin protein MshD